jgi:hypothetical protein
MTTIVNGNANGNANTKTYSANLNLVAGDNLITHNLGLASPFFLIVDIRDAVTGSRILLAVKNNTANTCIITTATNINNVNMKLL